MATAQKKRAGYGLPINAGGYEPSGWGAPSYPSVGFNTVMQGQSVGMPMRQASPPTPMNQRSPYLTGQAPIQQQAAAVQGYANSFQQAQANGTPGLGLLTNAGAQQLYGQSGYMPSTTIGGNWTRPQLATRMAPSAAANLSRNQALDARLAREAGTRPRPLPLSTGMGLPQVQSFAGAVDPATGRSRGLDVYQTSPTNAFGQPRQGGNVGLRASSGLRSQLMDRGLIQSQADYDAQVAANRPIYEARRGAEMDARRQAVRERGMQRAEARRVNSGQLTFDERLQASQPGLGIARVQAGADEKRTQAAERMNQAGLDFEKFRTEGNWREAAKAQRKMQRSQRELAELGSETQLGIAGLQTEAETTRAQNQNNQFERTFGQQERMQNIQLAQQFRESARSKKNARDFQGAAQDEAMANQLMSQVQGQMQGPGLPGVATQGPSIGPQGGANNFAALDAGSKQQYIGTDAQTTMANLMRAKATGEINASWDELDQFVESLFPNSGISAYNPDGYGLSDFIGTFTGLENVNTIGRQFNPNLPQPPRYGQLPSVPGLIQNYLGY